MRTAFIVLFLFACSSGGGGDGDDSNGSSGSDSGGIAADAGTPPSSDVTVTTIAELPGSKLFVRPDKIPAPGILMLHGSEGGSAVYIEEDARELAKAGFAVVTFCWFGCPGRPAKIHNIPLETTLAGLTWLANSSAVGGRKVGVFGVSRGAEQAVLLASLAPNQMVAVATHAASDTIVAAYDPATMDAVYEYDPTSGQYKMAASWTWQGTKLYGERDAYGDAGPRIEIEKYLEPMYLSHGENDMLWPVTRSKNIQMTRDAAGRMTEAHYWAGEDHIIMMPANIQQWYATMIAFYSVRLQL
jgi:dienelactone hydrolase